MKAKIWNSSFWVSDVIPEQLKKTYKKLLDQSGFHIVGFIEHHFFPQGYSALYLLTESHLAIHTFPEKNKTYIELSSCSKEFFDNFIKIKTSKCGIIKTKKNKEE